MCGGRAERAASTISGIVSQVSADSMCLPSGSSGSRRATVAVRIESNVPGRLQYTTVPLEL